MCIRDSNTCGTTGVGSYQRYRYGVRWFGDYRGAVAEMGRAATFCLDLRYWYPGRQFKYAEVDPPTLRNRDGKAVSGADLSRMSYAIWNFGRGNARNQAAATMLYVHGLMDDGAPGEVAKDVLGPTVEGVYDRIQRDADRYRGPYRLAVDLPARLTVGKEASGTVRVTSATGAGVPGVKVTLASADAAGLTRSVTTNAKGQASFDVTASAGGPLGLRATTEALAAARPRIFSPTVAAAARNGQRLAAPQGDTVEQEISRPVGKGTVAVTSRAFPRAVPAGGNSRDRVTITGGQGLRTKVGVALYGPFPTKQAVRCDAAPVATSSFDTNGKETYTTAATAVQQPGWYTYVISVPDSPSVQGVTTPCGEPSETFRVYAKPTMTSQVSTARLRPNEALSTAVTIKGLSGQTVPISVELFGPYASAQDATTCQTPPLQTQTLTAAGDGTYSTDPVTLTTPGYYVYRESSAGTELAMKSEIACGDPLETAVVVGSPKVVTQVSAQELVPGGTMHDTLVVTGLGPLKATINLELWGPYQSKAEMVCSGKPAWSGTIQANGDGTYTSPDVRVNTVGYYTYRERIAEAPQNDAELGACGEAAETTIVKAAPDVVTQVSNAVVRPGGTIFDRLKVTGAGTGALDIELELFGPFPTKAAGVGALAGLALSGFLYASLAPGMQPAAATTPVLGIRAALAFRTPQFAALAIGLVGLNAIQAMQQHLAPIFAEHGLALIAAGTLISLLALVAIPSTLATGVLNDRIGPLRTVTISTVLLVVGLLVVHLTSGYGPMAAFIVLLSPSAVMGPVLTSILVRHVFGTRDFVRLLGPLMATMPAGIALGTVLWGVVVDATGSYDLGVVISMGAAVVCLALITYAVTTGRRLALSG